MRPLSKRSFIAACFRYIGDSAIEKRPRENARGRLCAIHGHSVPKPTACLVSEPMIA